MQLEAIQHAREVRNRLRNPANAKPDSGIDLKRIVIECASEAVSVPIVTMDAAFGPEQDPDDVFGPKLTSQLPATIETITRAVAELLKVTRLDIKSGRRHAVFTHARHLVMYLCQTLTERSYPEIGRGLGGRNHSTVIHGVRSIQGKLCAGDPATIEQVDTLTAKFGARE